MRKNLLLILIVFLSAAFCLAMEPPQELKCEGEVDPEGIDTPEPTFSWEPDPESEQSAWQVIVSTDWSLIEDGKGSMWDSGKVYSEEEYCIYGSTGPSAGELLSNKYYYWAVRTWDEQNNHSEYAENAEFVMNHFIFRQSFEHPEEESYSGHAAGDINNNGYSDIVIARYGGDNKVDIYFNKGKENGENLFKHSQSIEETYASSVMLADFNNNGHLDLIFANKGGPEKIDGIQIYYNNGDGVFNEKLEFGKDYSGTRVIAVGDMNRNGYMDVVEALYAGEIRVFENQGDGSFQLGWESSEDDETNDVGLADLNGNSYLDIIAGNSNGPNRVYINNKNGEFTYKEIDLEEDFNTRGVVIADLNGNGHWDFISANAHTDGIENAYYLNDGSGNFKLKEKSNEEDCSYSISSADVTGNGMMDYAVGNIENNRVYKHRSMWPFNIYRDNFSEDTETRSIFLSDFTGDGRVDMLWGLRYDNDRLYVNNHGPVNEPPQPPDEGFGGYYDGEHLNLQWGSGYDEQTDEKQLAYNLRVSTVSKEGPWNILSGAVGTTDSSGSFWGNIGRSTYVHLNVEPKTYFWQVQAINTAKKAGEWSEGQVVNTPPEGEWVASKPRELDFVLERDPLNYRDNNRYHVDVKFRIKDSEFNDCRISRFHYSTHPSGDWHLVDDESATLDGIWDDGAGDYYFYEALDEYDRVYDFLWKTGEHLGEGFKGDLQVKFTVSDIHGASTTVTSSDFFVDNRNPEKPGALIPTDKYDAESLTLKFSTPASDDNFSEYVIYYLDESSQWDDPWHYSDGDYYDDYITSQDYSPLGEEDFGGVSTITVSGLKADTVYHFALFAYDKYGNFSYSDTLSKKTNHPPEVEIVSVEQRRDGSGLADILFKGRDYDIEYSSYVYEGCSFWLGAGERREMTPAYEDERFDSEIFFTEEFSTYTFVWNAAEDIPDTEHASAVVELSFTDGRDESATGLSEAFVVDTRPPVLGGLYTEDPTASTIEWVWDGALDNNFDRYELWYSSAGAEYVSEDSYVLERDTSSARYIEIDDIDTHSYTVYGLEGITDYWGCLWAFDEYGNINRTSTAPRERVIPLKMNI